jgi:hypothetical protein
MEAALTLTFEALASEVFSTIVSSVFSTDSTSNEDERLPESS